MNQQRFSYLLSLYSNNLISFEEQSEFFEMVSTGDYDDILMAAFESDLARSTLTQAESLSPAANKKIIRSVLSGEKGNKVKKIGSGKAWLLSAAAVLAIVFTTAVICLYQTKGSPNAFIAEFIKKNPEQFNNTTGHPVSVFLPDSSCIILEPGASVNYSTVLFTTKREVCLEGEAMFKITKDPLKPFYVFYNDIVTKVLGTTFTVRTNPHSGNIEVEVLTGKVQVYENERVFHRDDKKAGVIVTPNQKAVYAPNEGTIAATLADQPVILKGDHALLYKPDDAAEQFHFENTTLSRVFKRIESNYGIRIIVSDAYLNECVFNGNISNQSLYDKLKIICLSVNADYEINGTSIVITAKKNK